MARWLVTLAAVALVACGGGDDSVGDTEPTTDGGACGELTKHDLTVSAKVVDVDKVPVAGAEIRLLEDGWNVTEEVYGTAITGADGIGSFNALNVVAIEDCWGTVLNYRLTAQLGEKVGENDYNSSLFNAISGGSGEVDTTSFPITIE